MKRTPLIFAALVPFVVTAGQGMGSQQVDQQELMDDLQATKILGAEVKSSSGEDVGTVEDIIFSRDGSIASVLVQREGSVSDMFGAAGDKVDQAADNTEDAADEGWNDMKQAANETGDAAERNVDEATDEEEDNLAMADAGEDDLDVGENDGEASVDVADASLGDDGIGEDTKSKNSGMDESWDPDRADTMEMGDKFATLKWSDVSFMPGEETLYMKGSASSLQSVSYDQTSDMSPEGDVRASKLVGLEVNLADEDSFGEVEDVMIDPKTGKASAIVIDSMEFFDKERYAVPVNLDSINFEEEELTLQLTEQQLEDMGEFDLDKTGSNGE